MKNNQKHFLTILPRSGTGVIVVDGDINYAVNTFKRNIKQSGKLKEVQERREYVKPSVSRREVIDRAKRKK